MYVQEMYCTINDVDIDENKHSRAYVCTNTCTYVCIYIYILANLCTNMYEREKHLIFSTVDRWMPVPPFSCLVGQTAWWTWQFKPMDWLVFEFSTSKSWSHGVKKPSSCWGFSRVTSWLWSCCFNSGQWHKVPLVNSSLIPMILTLLTMIIYKSTKKKRSWNYFSRNRYSHSCLLPGPWIIGDKSISCFLGRPRIRFFEGT